MFLMLSDVGTTLVPPLILACENINWLSFSLSVYRVEASFSSSLDSIGVNGLCFLLPVSLA
jgi:hypothetical protein